MNLCVEEVRISISFDTNTYSHLYFVYMLESFLNSFLSFMTLAGHIGLVVFFVLYLFYRKTDWVNSLLNFLADKAILLSFLLMLSSMIGSLVYSDIIGYIPCLLCWYQRIFIYSMTFMFATALVVKDKVYSRIYGLVLATAGGLIALYQYYLQMSGKDSLACEIGGSISCSEIYTLSFGYITIPLMALTVFVFVILLLVNKKRA